MKQGSVSRRVVKRSLALGAGALSLFAVNALAQDAELGMPANQPALQPANQTPALTHASLRWSVGLDAWANELPTPMLLGAAPRRVGGNGLYAYVTLPSTLPLPLHKLLGKPEGGVTLELRSGPSFVGQLGLGSVVRWNLSDSGQMALRLRGGKLGLQYGLKFNL
jgi:hypothetical protein